MYFKILLWLARHNKRFARSLIFTAQVMMKQCDDFGLTHLAFKFCELCELAKCDQLLHK